jgi:lipoprotein-releasing system permease protein
VLFPFAGQGQRRLASPPMSPLPFELSLALRYLRPKRTFVSAITFISIVGVTLGVAVLVIVIAVMSGFDKEWHERILGFNAHLKVLPSTPGPMEDYERVAAGLRENPEVKGVAPFILGKVPLRMPKADGGEELDVQVLRGIDAEAERTVSVLANNIVFGDYDVSDHGLLIGLDFARAHGLRVGDRVALYSLAQLKKMDAGRRGGEEIAVLPDDFTVRGIFDVGFADYNALVIFTSIESAQELFELNFGVHGAMAVLDDPFKVSLVQRDLESRLGDAFHVVTWSEEFSEIFGALVVEKNMIRFLLFFIVLVAAFGITSSQITFVVQKTREIGTLKALGATNSQITWIFLGQSCVVGALGVAVGLGLGLTALRWRNEFLDLMNRVMGFDLLPAAIYKIYELPVLILTSDLLVICGGSLLICLVAGVVPAWIAGRLQPVEALRHE